MSFGGKVMSFANIFRLGEKFIFHVKWQFRSDFCRGSKGEDIY